MKRAHIYFIGNVQGVGFRYTTQRLASNLNLVGWVKNLADGSVEAVVEGDQKKIHDLIEELKKHFSDSIKDCRVNFNEAYGQFKRFEITQ